MAKKENTYTKEQLKKSRRYESRVDLVEALLEDGKEYTIEAVDATIETYMKKEVR